uniref:BPTI/Kunitz inhibitor domain-containing protein n=1 Tax=Equus asinus asinus TaxID=83772 RepID=A0A8C4N6J1_EQUAS
MWVAATTQSPTSGSLPAVQRRQLASRRAPLPCKKPSLLEEFSFVPPAFCLEPPYVGRCRAMIRRYFYNATSAQCETFTYGGCRQKKNNFISKEECLKTCRGEGAALQGKVGGGAGRGRPGERGRVQGGPYPSCLGSVFPLGCLPRRKWQQCAVTRDGARPPRARLAEGHSRSVP